MNWDSPAKAASHYVIRACLKVNRLGIASADLSSFFALSCVIMAIPAYIVRIQLQMTNYCRVSERGHGNREYSWN